MDCFKTETDLQVDLKITSYKKGMKIIDLQVKLNDLKIKKLYTNNKSEEQCGLFFNTGFTEGKC